jgi:hypothetical protein
MLLGKNFGQSQCCWGKVLGLILGAEFRQLGKNIGADSWGRVYVVGEKSKSKFLGQSLSSWGKVLRQS